MSYGVISREHKVGKGKWSHKLHRDIYFAVNALSRADVYIFGRVRSAFCMLGLVYRHKLNVTNKSHLTADWMDTGFPGAEHFGMY